MKTILLATIAAIILATGAQAFDRKVEQMIDTERQLNDVCRDKPGDSPEGKAACAKRDALYQQLTAAGMCWGRDDEVEAQKEWRECKPQAAPAQTPEQIVRQAVRADLDDDLAARMEDPRGRVYPVITANKTFSWAHRELEDELYECDSKRNAQYILDKQEGKQSQQYAATCLEIYQWSYNEAAKWLNEHSTIARPR